MPCQMNTPNKLKLATCLELLKSRYGSNGKVKTASLYRFHCLHKNYVLRLRQLFLELTCSKLEENVARVKHELDL